MSGFSSDGWFLYEPLRNKGLLIWVFRNGVRLKLFFHQVVGAPESFFFEDGELRPEFEHGDRYKVCQSGDLVLVKPISPKLSDDATADARQAVEHFLLCEQQLGT